MKNLKWISLSKAFNDYVESDKLVSLNNSFELLALIKKIGWRLVATCFSGSMNLSRRSIQAYNFGKYILRMRKHHGEVFTVSYLKASQLAVQKQIGKDKIKSLRALVSDLPLPRLSSSGLPRFIPLRDRRAICSGSVSVIRWWLTLFSIYRVLSCPSKLKLNTITDGFSGDKIVLDKISKELGVLASSFRKRNPKPLSPGSFLWLESASPSSRTSWTGLIADALLLRHLGLSDSLEFFLEKNGSYNLIRLWKAVLKLSDHWSMSELLAVSPVKDSWSGTNVGQLSAKKEAAGKVRIFALVDVWTQCVLKPLHDWLFEFLKTLPNDGTFDQYASVKRCMLKVKISQRSFGYDLSAATDRLPIALQISILTSFFGGEFAGHWSKLLVGREYILNNKEFGTHSVKYSVGQPMGALSSWAMLAVTHHLIVQYCAKSTGRSRPGVWYDNYEILGDDIILFDEVVARSYLAVMAGLGVGITLSKSVVSLNETIEFAKVTGYNGQNVSAISWKMFMSQRSLMGRANIVYSLLNKDIAPSNMIGWFTNITKVSKAKSMGYSYSLLAVLSMYMNSMKLPISTLSKALTDVLNPRRQAYKNSLMGAPLRRLEDLLVRLGRRLPLPDFSKGDRFWYRDEMSMKGDIHSRIENFRIKFDLYKVVTQTAKEAFDLVLPNLAFDEISKPKLDKILDCFLCLLIESSKRPMLDVFSSTYYTNGIPGYFMGILEEKDIQHLESLSALDTFGQPLDSYWLKRLEDIDTLRTLEGLPKRAKAKFGGQDPANIKLDSPLKPLQILLKGRKGWTQQYGG